ncbi:desmoplakin-B isoform X1 [Festucalex cinctus]
MSQYDSHNALSNMSLSRRGEPMTASGGSFRYTRSEFVQGGGNGYEHFMDGSYNTFPKSNSGGGMAVDTIGRMASSTGGAISGLNDIHQRAVSLQAQCQEDLRRAEFALQSGGNMADAEHYMLRAKETIDQLKAFAMDLRQMGQPSDNVVRAWELCNDQLKGVHLAMSGSLQRRRSAKGGSDSWEEPGRSFHDAVAWIGQQKRLIETTYWGEDPAGIEKNLISHQRFHNSIQNSPEVDRARSDLIKKGDKGNLHALDQEWDSLQQMSFARSKQLGDLQQIIQELSKEIMWVNDKEEEELMFDWGDKNLDQYIPRKQESYSKLMSALEEKEKHLNKLKVRVDALLKNQHPASDKIEAYRDTLQTQWSWLLQITKCIDVHLKENAAYNQFFKEANEMCRTLKGQQESIRKKFTCDKNMSLEDLVELLRGLERERERLRDHKNQVQQLVNKSKSIVRLKSRNPEEKSSRPVIVKALCDFKQDQKVICKGDEAILKDNSQRSKWEVTGPGGLDMIIPSVCLILPPPNPLSINLATKNEQYYESIMSLWNQLYINVKSLIAWQYCLLDINRINSLTISMLSRMSPEEYAQLINSLETHYEEFKLSCQGSQMFTDVDRRSIESQFNGAQAYYGTLLVQLPAYQTQQTQQPLIIMTAAADEDARKLEEERQRTEVKKVKKEVVRAVKTEPAKKKVAASSSHSLTELHALRLKLEAAEGLLSQHVHICLGDDGTKDCGLKITQLESTQLDVNTIKEAYMKLRENILKELESMNDSDKAQFLRSELEFITQRLASLESNLSMYLLRLQALRDLLESMARAEDIVKVHEARLTEKETTSLLLGDVNDYLKTLKAMQYELDGKSDVLATMEAELAKANHWNGQVGGPFYRCDMMLSKYNEQVGLLSDRWRRIKAQIDTRLQDLQQYLPQLEHYKQSSSSLSDWIGDTRRKQDTLQAANIQNVQSLKEHINNQKALNAEIKAKRVTLESVLKDNDACVTSIKDYETDLGSYTSGLETLLNIPIKRTMLRSPSIDLVQEATQLQTRYMELLTLSDDYLKFIGELLKNMEDLKIRSTRIDLLEEELRRLREAMEDRNSKNKSLEDTVARYQLELSQSQDKLLSLEEIKRTTALQCNAAKDSLDDTHNQLADLADQVTRLNYLLEEEKRKRKLAEERHTQQQDEYESVLRKRHTELESVSWSKVEVEKTMANQEHEIKQLQRKLEEETSKVAELQKEISKVRSQCTAKINNLKLNYESQIQVSHAAIQRLSAQREDDTSQLQLQYDRMQIEGRVMEEELRRLITSVSQAEELKKRAEEEAHRQRSVIAEEEHMRRELESEIAVLIKQREEENNKYKEDLAEVEQELEKKTEQLAYVTHSLEEEVRRRKTTEEGKGVLEQTLAELQTKLASSAMAVAQQRECEAELQNVRLELERENRDRSRVEENLNRLQVRLKDIQSVRDGLEVQLTNLREANQEEVSKRRQTEIELEKTAATMREYYCTINTLRQNQEQVSASEMRGEQQCLLMQEELERSLKKNRTSVEQLAQMSTELKALQHQLLQEQVKVKEVNLRNEGLYRTIEEKSKALNENYSELQTLKETTETLTKERLRLEEELRTTRRDKAELLRFKEEDDDEVSSQITALELQLQASERNNLDYHNLVSEISLERDNLKLETEKMQIQATETSTTMLSLQSQYDDTVKERDALLLKLQFSGTDKDDVQRLEEELRRIKLSLESERQNKQRAQEENERVKRDLSYWKEQYDSKKGLVNQFDADKERLERENTSLKRETERLLRELSELEKTYKGKLSVLQTELTELTIVRQTMQDELKKTREPQTVDPSTVIFDGVRKPVTAAQLLECGILDKPTFNRVIRGQKSVPDASVDIKVSLKGTGPIAGVIIENPQSDSFISECPFKISLTEAKKECLLPPDAVDLLLDAQAATGHIIEPRTNQKLTVEEAVAAGVVDPRDEDRLLAAQAAAIGYKDRSAPKPLSVYEALKRGLIDKKIGLRLLQAQECVGGILDPNLSVFLPKVTAISRNILDENIGYALNQNPRCYLDPDNDHVAYGDLKKRCKTEAHTGLLLLPVTEGKDPSKFIFDGVRKPVTAQQLHDCGILDKHSFNQLTKGQKTVPQLSEDKKVFLKGTGPIAGVAIGSLGTVSLSEAKKQLLMPPQCADLLLDAQAATGHIIDPRTNQRFTVEEACTRGLVDIRDRDRLLAAESAALGYRDPSTAKPLSVFQAMNKGLIDKKTGLRLLQAQDSSGGIIDPNLSVFLPKDIAMSRNILDEGLCKALNRNAECYLDPDTEFDVSYEALKKKCKTEFNTGLIILPIIERKDPSKLMFDGVRKSVSAKQLFECGVLDKPTFDQLLKGEKTVSEVSAEKVVYLKGTGPIAGVEAGNQGKVSLSEAKKQCLLSTETADLLLEAQAATGHIIDPITYQKLTVDEACARGIVDIKDRDKLLAAEAAAIGYKDPSTAKPLSVYEAMKRGIINWKTGLRFLQAQECVGGILDPNLSVFLPKDTAIKRNLLDEDLRKSLNQSPTYYINPEPELDVSYGALKQRCKTESHSGLQLLPISEKMDPSKLIFDGVRKTVTAQQLFDCGILDKATLNQLVIGEKTVPEVSVEKQVFLKGTGLIAGVAAGSFQKMSFTQAKKQSIISPDSADLLLEAQAATGHIINPQTNQKFTVKEACARGVVSKEDESKLFAAEAAAIGYRDPNTSQLLSAGQAMKKGLIDKDTALRILQAQECAGGILDPTLGVYLPKDIAMDRDLINADLYKALSQEPECYLDPDTQLPISYLSLKKRCRADIGTGFLLLPEPKKPATVQGLRSQVSVIDLVDAKLLEPSDIDELNKGRLTSQDIEYRLRAYLGRSTCIAGLFDETSDRVMTFYEAKKNKLLQPETALELLEAQAASGFIVDPVNNVHLSVGDAYNKGLFGPECLDTLRSAERAVTGYKLLGTEKVISLFQAIKRGMVAKGHGTRLLEAQIASGGIIDPEHSHRIDIDVAYNKGYLDEEMNKLITNQNLANKDFLDPNTEEKVTYLELKKRCITDGKTGLILLPIVDKEKQEATMKNTLRKRRVIIVDPQTNKEMNVREAYEKGLIDYSTYQELSQQECEWEEITITEPDGSKRLVIIDRKTGREYNINELLEKRVIDQSVVDQYRSHIITLTQLADIITEKTPHGLLRITSTSQASFPPSGSSSSSSSSTIISKSSSITKTSTTIPPTIKEYSFATSSGSRGSSDTQNQKSSVSFTLASPVESVGEKDPVGVIFDTETLDKISVMEALNSGLVDTITAQRLLEAQACTGGIINPENGRRLSIQEASRQGIINDDMAAKLKPAQKVFIGFEDVKTGKKMSAAEAMKEMWLPYEAGQRFMEFQFVTGGLYDPELGCRRTIADALKMGWIDGSTARKLQDVRHQSKNLTCPKSKLKISYKEALDNCLVEESTGLRMLPASSVSSRGISSPYNFSSAPGSSSGSRSGSRRSSRRSSLDLGSPTSLSTSHYSHTIMTNR